MLRTITSGLVLAAGIAVLAACSPSPLADPAKADNTTTVPQCTDAIADAQGICQGIPTWELEPRDGYTIESPRQLGSEGTDDGHPFLTTDEPPIQEDDPRWDCRFDGNQTCGVEIEGVWYLVQFEDGSPVSVGYRGTGY